MASLTCKLAEEYEFKEITANHLLKLLQIVFHGTPHYIHYLQENYIIIRQAYTFNRVKVHEKYRVQDRWEREK